MSTSAKPLTMSEIELSEKAVSEDHSWTMISSPEIPFGGLSTAETPPSSQLLVNLPPYNYSPLPGDRNIRILEVYGADSYDTTLCFRITTVSLDSAPPYYAVSYCWENQTPTQLVICEGQTITLTINCEAALKQFRPRQGETVLIWIDAVCIDQARGAVRERNEQVFMMGDVYAKAAQVWVWLGSDRMKSLPVSTIRILNWLRDLSVAASIKSFQRRDDEVLRVALEMNHQDLHDLEYDMPWFTRIWVLQEVLLSRSAILYRDTIPINYRGLINATNLIASLASSNPALLLHDTYLRTNFRMFRRLEAIKAKPGSSSGLRQIWNNARRFYSSDPRDKVFALHSLLTSIGLPLPPPDYTKDVGTVYRETTKAILVYDRSLGILKQITGLGVRTDLSSWSPDWNQRVYPKRPFARPGMRFQASGRSRPAFKFSADGKLAICQGKIIESISMVAKDSMTHTWERLGQIQKYLEWTLNALPQEEFWREVLERNPEWSESILLVWNVHVLQTLIAFVASTANEDQAEEDIYKDLQDCLGDFIESDSGSFARVAKFGDWDAWRNSIMAEYSDEKWKVGKGKETEKPEETEETEKSDETEKPAKPEEPDNPDKPEETPPPDSTPQTTQTPDPSQPDPSQPDKPLPSPPISTPPLPHRPSIPQHQDSQISLVGHREITDFQHLRTRLLSSPASTSALLSTPEFRAWSRVCEEHSQAALHGAIISTTHYQTLFRTQTTNKLGMAPHSVREGDQIALLAGLDSPMVIRAVGNGNWRMVSAGYVCGMMGGEAWDREWNRGEGLDELTFE
ncbi:uncharacterized protein LY89DRAFT_147358 [Mollisia scopiformis]|uniref:Heterokaryon incompatibility domain-containing protein n=1 Tax=Mollisia scopiformis TaxID=149040 RepID=A0A194X1T6_MOLSC|nr:uncharacterized protein LY89DRAFT_147358 [Mollisia scopiformis]KUJ13797.1 hypothetical protein LY89DRAFT_147358 [Mollisia scopiformis]